jgi:hypothetical protein
MNEDARRDRGRAGPRSVLGTALVVAAFGLMAAFLPAGGESPEDLERRAAEPAPCDEPGCVACWIKLPEGERGPMPPRRYPEESDAEARAGGGR